MREPYSLLIRSQAKKKLQGLPRSERFRIAEKLEQLGRNPDDSSLDIKKLEGEPYFRLRVGDWRIIYERHDVVKIIAVEKIKPRGDAYK
ncbi:MAG: type II toxin-antitoxin system RelE/ParE family toxin [Nitrosomonas sp.]|jgi:mRNA interferase RelE/StbE|uniref:type II toxin-antitoxin system RelE family toxin n=1 Tax=Nitrosomonas sp. TaxID=42353 RepID=UPI00272FF676|nr:type II toxin-antitoxin system RelE/ParE family toxin [Nitrosomonas sp.]MBK6958677.1 type II toxin-antitoxin system RelE/ParE family toxin [Nitrosomonas sp.]MDP1550554.1 type II toxin-antitoxin system RelE/ParE family toxin [Nitrosomonas sp.]MDP1934298.1 type II toxin-antitoxin system RelE/ParE family toxin [Nitrosomonas sp.]